MVDIVGGGRTVDQEYAVRSIMHPAAVVRLHLQGVDEGRLVAVVHQVFGIAGVTVEGDHRHDLIG